ncbi:12-oxophytodienoate reductase-like protein [Nicotiana tabacum]|uniref:12-oxophytodienoate reductase-like protein n=2 Tax=Nicotiana TaxID=4085 RepID=A0A1S3XL35_TOBAC|nr:PREDICTED: 12-oxophytodienoate reductase-like protein [Nicotiana sylvestris]XP_016440646.1 PREDICTED: 12-oxophytodienoate reductase-like protein [Nicotiana tabacum]
MEAANNYSNGPLFTPYKLGKFDLSHRIVFPALTRNRAHKNIPQQPHATEYYAQRATNGGLLISEAAAASDISQGCPNMPGIWNEEQVEAWKPVVEGVHEKGGVFFCQIWHSGRLFVPTLSALYFSIGVGFSLTRPDEQVYEKPTPRRLKSDEVPGIVNDFRIAARNAIKAGFDGVEINASDGGYLIDEFMNDRKSIEDCCRLALEIVQAVANEIGADKVGIKLSPFSDCDGKKDSNSERLATYLANALSKLGVLYLHVVEPREAAKGLLPIRKAFQGTLIASGGYNKFDGDNAIEENYADLISFGRMFLANPDLPKRFEVNAPLNKYNRSTFYTNDPLIGYTDYPSLQVAS